MPLPLRYNLKYSLRGVPWLILALISFVVSDILIKMLLNFYSVVETTYLRAAGRFIPSVLIAFLVSNPKSIFILKDSKLHFLRCVITTASTFLFLLAYKLIPLSQSYALGYSAPLFVIILAKLLLNENFGKHKLLAVLVGLIGIVIAVNPDMELRLGSAVVLIAAFLASLNKIFIKHLLKQSHNLTLIIYQNLFLLVVLTPFLSGNWITPSPRHIGYLLLISSLALLAQYAMIQAIRLSPLSVLAPFDYNSFIFVILLEYTIWDTIPSISLLGGVILIIFSNLYILYNETKNKEEDLNIEHKKSLGEGAKS